jgi:CheY-like chemotaxis protein
MSQSQILIIEDDPVVARSLQAGLNREGFAVTWKSTGAEGGRVCPKVLSTSCATRYSLARWLRV